MKDLVEIASRYPTDKNEHGYMPYYQKHLPETVGSFLEIGVWKGGGINSFKEYYDSKGEFHVINYVYGKEIISVEELKKMGIIAHAGEQADIEFLKTVPCKYDVISEDGSHHSDEQVITFKHLFINNVKSGGLYVVEDTHCCFDEFWWRGIVTKFDDTIIAIFKNYLEGGSLESQFITKEESDLLMSLIAEVNIYNDQIIFIKKK